MIKEKTTLSKSDIINSYQMMENDKRQPQEEKEEQTFSGK